MKILITGVAGFIGTNLASRLLQDEHEVIGVDNFLTGSHSNVQKLSKSDSFKFIEQDVINPLSIEDNIDWILHFASPASPPKYLEQPIKTLLVNSQGTFNLLELAKTKKASFFLASTSEVYGDPHEHPQKETYWGNVNPVGPRAVYDEAKRFGETIAVTFNKKFGLPIRIIRIFNTYGPFMDANDGRVITNFINQGIKGIPLTIFGEGEQTRSFQFIDDLVEGIVRLIDVDYFNPVNLGNPEEFTMLELAQITKELTDNSLPLDFKPLPQDDPKQRKPDISLAKKLLDWSPKIKLNEGLQKTINYFKSLNF